MKRSLKSNYGGGYIVSAMSDDVREILEDLARRVENLEAALNVSSDPAKPGAVAAQSHHKGRAVDVRGLRLPARVARLAAGLSACVACQTR